MRLDVSLYVLFMRLYISIYAFLTRLPDRFWTSLWGFDEAWCQLLRLFRGQMPACMFSRGLDVSFGVFLGGLISALTFFMRLDITLFTFFYEAWWQVFFKFRYYEAWYKHLCSFMRWGLRSMFCLFDETSCQPLSFCDVKFTDKKLKQKAFFFVFVFSYYNHTIFTCFLFVSPTFPLFWSFQDKKGKKKNNKREG